MVVIGAVTLVLALAAAVRDSTFGLPRWRRPRRVCCEVPGCPASWPLDRDPQAAFQRLAWHHEAAHPELGSESAQLWPITLPSRCPDIVHRRRPVASGRFVPTLVGGYKVKEKA
jgi:hypothetical protein